MRALAIAPVLVVMAAAFVFWVWTLVDVVRVPEDQHFRAGNQLIWVIVIVFTQIIGLIIYVAVGRPPRRPAA